MADGRRCDNSCGGDYPTINTIMYNVAPATNTHNITFNLCRELCADLIDHIRGGDLVATAVLGADTLHRQRRVRVARLDARAGLDRQLGAVT